MSDNFADKNNANLTRHATIAAALGGGAQQQQQAGVAAYVEFIGGGKRGDALGDDDIQIQCDHMYATHRAATGAATTTTTAAATVAAVVGGGGCGGGGGGASLALHQPDDELQRSAESEVNFIKDFLLIHLDLIQQQNDEIVSKDNVIFLLQQENQQLREEKKLLESQLAARLTVTANDQHHAVDTSVDLAQREDMIIDSTTILVEHIEQTTPILQPASNLPAAVGIPAEESIAASAHIEAAPAESEPQPPELQQQLPIVAGIVKAELPDDADGSDYANTSYTIHSTAGADPMKNLKMSIRRKRLCSNSSATWPTSNGTPPTAAAAGGEEKRPHVRHAARKKRKRSKHDEMLTHADEYITQAGEHLMDIIRRQELAEEVAKAANSASLEVPRWRGKVYTSCYSLEGTENLDDEVFLRRHSRMENDEKRRKRWDFQRIREQRVIEKLKQRQDKIDSNNKSTPMEEPEPISSLWPSLEDLKMIEFCDDLPVAAFGAPVPKIQPSEFSLPWLTHISVKKPARRSGTMARRRRRSSKR